jgi:allantoinase
MSRSDDGYGDLVVLTSTRVILNEGNDPVPATLEISGSSGKFVAIKRGIATRDQYAPSVKFHDYGDLVIMPGLVDSHVHIDEPYFPLSGILFLSR